MKKEKVGKRLSLIVSVEDSEQKQHHTYFNFFNIIRPWFQISPENKVKTWEGKTILIDQLLIKIEFTKESDFNLVLHRL